MARLVSLKAELAVLRGMCSKNKKIAGALLSNTDESYFYSEESVELYQAIKRHMHESGTAPSYRLLIEDPEISEDARSHMRDSQASVLTVEDADKAARILNRYRQTRGLFNLASHINDAMKGSRLNIDNLLEDSATAINIVRSKKSNNDAFTHFGRNNNSKELVHDILYGDNSEDLIPSGIEAFDEVNGGFARGSLVTAGANSGGGKSVLAGAMGLKMAALGYKVLFVPLEMSEKEMTQRILANVTKTNLTKIIRQQLATGERDLVFKRQRRWERRVKEAGGRFTIFKPREDMNIEEIMAATAAYQCDVMIIDYISLLKGVDGDDQWRALGSVARYAKINAEIEGRVNILLCQVSDDGKIRYARAISEHSSNSLIWINSKEQKESGITRIEQPKSRNSMAFPFSVKFVWDQMRIERAPTDESLGAVEHPPGSDAEDPKKAPKRRKMPNLATDT